MLEPSSNKNVLVYIKNEGDSAVSLSLQTSNWNSSNASPSDYISLNWDYKGQFINVGEIVPVTFALSISASIGGTETLSFDITVTVST